jgi:hypothetical protein
VNRVTHSTARRSFVTSARAKYAAQETDKRLPHGKRLKGPFYRTVCCARRARPRGPFRQAWILVVGHLHFAAVLVSLWEAKLQQRLWN